MTLSAEVSPEGSGHRDADGHWWPCTHPAGCERCNWCGFLAPSCIEISATQSCRINPRFVEHLMKLVGFRYPYRIDLKTRKAA